MFVTPLLTLLSDALVHHDDAVVAQSADDGFGDAAAGGNLRDAGLFGDGVDDICRGGLSQLLSGYDRDGGCGVLQLCVTRNACHHQFVQFQMLIEHISGVVRMYMVMMMMLVLCCRCYAYAKQ